MARTTSKKFGSKLVLGSVAAVALIAALEGGRQLDGSSVAYADKLAGGRPTVCEGLTSAMTRTPIIVGERWSRAKCDAEVGAAVIRLQLKLEQCFVLAPPQTVFDAATSFAWNIGAASACASVAMQNWRRGNWLAGCERMARDITGKRVWSYVKTGKILPNGKPEYRFILGIANRRDKEVAYCMKGVRE